MGDDPGRVGLVVVGGDDQGSLGAGLRRCLGQRDRVAGVVGARAADHRSPAADLVDHRAQQRDVLLVVEGRRLARRPGDDDAVRAVLDQVGRELSRRGLVHPAVGVERGRHRGQDSFDLRHRRQGIQIVRTQSSFSSPTVKRSGRSADPAHGEQDAGHEGAAVDRVVADLSVWPSPPKMTS